MKSYIRLYVRLSGGCYMNKTVIELFAGVGGFHLGLKNASGWDVLWANQWEPGKKLQHAAKCYEAHFPETELMNRDIAEVNDNPDRFPIPKHNLLVGGFPCQDYSVASTGAKGIEGKKGVLWWEIHRILNSHRPPFVLLENVDRLLKSPTKQRGRDFAVMLACFRDLGYTVEWRVINAADYGFSQRRRRVFIFAYHNSTEYFKRQTENDNFSNMKNYILENGFFSKEFPIKEVIDQPLIEFNQDVKTISDTHKGAFFEAGVMQGQQVYTAKYVAKIQEAKKLGQVLQSNVDEKYFLGEDLAKWEYMKGSKGEPRKTKEGFEYMFREGAIAFPDPLDRPARTMLTSESSKNRSTHVVADPQKNGRLRVLTPIECERLNGFEDDWTNTGMPEKFRYFCMGNALVVGLVTKMGQTLNEIFEQELEEPNSDENIIKSAKVESECIVKEAKEKAEVIKKAAELEAQQIIRAAREREEEIIQKAIIEAKSIIDASKVKV
jgi:DNA (cytosine-5)-methyltransferase 1